MRTQRLGAALVVAALLLSLTACAGAPAQSSTSAPPAQSVIASAEVTPSIKQIYLYGERHGEKKILDGELELWDGYYQNEGMRHLFIESPYYTGELLNEWMRSDSDKILDAVYDDWEGSLAHNPDVKEFYRQIKLRCPETIFHGTDVGHQYDTTGERYLQFLRDKQLEDSEEYQWAQEVMEQGRYFYDQEDAVYRENKMTENFIREFDRMNGDSVMGIYGGAHTNPDAMDYETQSVPSMAKQLKERYGGALHAEDLYWMTKTTESERVDVIELNGTEYQASYFGKEDLTGFKDFASREFWRLENAYDDFKEQPKDGDELPYDNYPMLIEEGQVFVIDITKTDGSAVRWYYRSDGGSWEGQPTTERFAAE